MSNYFNILWIIISYILGSIPFGYIITKFSTKRNILEIGWRKTSGSNVFKNIGFWQGFLTGVFDLGKGFLAVRLAQNFNLPVLVQALSGVAAVTGHNWSCFLNFAGGRGIGTFIGSGFALSPTILGISVIPLITIAVIWNASPGTIVFLITFVILSYHNQLQTGVLLGLVSLIPIFIKRLSPIKEIEYSEDKKALIRNRLIFDDDIPYLELRIKRILKKLTKS